MFNMWRRRVDAEGSRTLQRVMQFAGEAVVANQRYRGWAEEAEAAGWGDAAAFLRKLAEAELVSANELIRCLASEPVRDGREPVDLTPRELRDAIVAELYAAARRNAGFSREAREDGFARVAEQFEVLALAVRSRATRANRILSRLDAVSLPGRRGR